MIQRLKTGLIWFLPLGFLSEAGLRWLTSLDLSVEEVSHHRSEAKHISRNYHHTASDFAHRYVGRTYRRPGHVSGQDSERPALYTNDTHDFAYRTQLTYPGYYIYGLTRLRSNDTSSRKWSDSPLFWRPQSWLGSPRRVYLLSSTGVLCLWCPKGLILPAGHQMTSLTFTRTF